MKFLGRMIVFKKKIILLQPHSLELLIIKKD